MVPLAKQSNPYTATTGDTKDISDISKFGFFQWVMYFNKSTPSPKERWLLGRCLGPTKNVGNAMCQWILQSNGTVVARRTVRHLNAVEKGCPVIKREMDEMMGYTYGKHGTPFREKNAQSIS